MVTYQGIQISTEIVRSLLMSRSTPLFMATDVAWMMGFRQVDSNHGAYRPILRALNKLYEYGEIGKYFIPEANVSVFYRIP
jgi:cytochrome b subunit of formate dehydrogenase